MCIEMGGEIMETKLFTFNEAQKILPLSRSGMFQAAKRGDIPTVRVGKRVFIPAWWITKITSEPSAQPGA